MTDNEKRVVVVTGGGSGIGESCSEVLAADGCLVVVADINLEHANAVAQRIGGVPWQLDVAADQSVESAAKDIEIKVGPVYGLVNSAGIAQPTLPPHKLDMEIWDRIQRVHLRGTYICCREFSRGMLARRKGGIVNITSLAGLISSPSHSYAPAKAAITSMTHNLAAEWGPSGIRVNAVAPGFTLTPALIALSKAGGRNWDRLVSSNPLGRLVEPVEVAHAVAFLLSDHASAITGADLPVDCGFLAGGAWHAYGGFHKPE